MPAKQQKVRIAIDPRLTAEEREELADDIIEYIKRRTESGVDKDGRKFPKYSKGYADSLDFKIAGKSKARVDLTLSGDMLAELQVLKSRKGELVIGYEAGTEENARAEGNILGSYGGDPDPSKARDFLGISDKDLKRIQRHYLEDLD